MVEMLLDRGADPDGKFCDNKYGALYFKDRVRLGMSPLNEAVTYGQLGVVKLLIARGANVRAKSPLGMTALHFAALAGKADAVKVLLANGADPTAKARGQTPLDCARERGREDVVKILEEIGEKK